MCFRILPRRWDSLVCQPVCGAGWKILCKIVGRGLRILNFYLPLHSLIRFGGLHFEGLLF